MENLAKWFKGYFSSDGVGVERGLIIYAYTGRKTRLKLTSPVKVNIPVAPFINMVYF